MNFSRVFISLLALSVCCVAETLDDINVVVSADFEIPLTSEWIRGIEYSVNQSNALGGVSGGRLIHLFVLDNKNDTNLFAQHALEAERGQQFGVVAAVLVVGANSIQAVLPRFAQEHPRLLFLSTEFTNVYVPWALRVNLVCDDDYHVIYRYICEMVMTRDLKSMQSSLFVF